MKKQIPVRVRHIALLYLGYDVDASKLETHKSEIRASYLTKPDALKLMHNVGKISIDLFLEWLGIEPLCPYCNGTGKKNGVK